MAFTDRQIAALKPKAVRYEKKEPGRTGLGIRVSPDGSKRWTFVYRFDGKQRRMVLGDKPYPLTSVAKAHALLGEAREKIRQGIDPGAEIAEAKQVERNAETFADLVDEYMRRYARGTNSKGELNMKEATADERERILKRNCLPMLGDKKAKDITRRDLIAVLDEIEDRGAHVMRNRVATALSGLFEFAMDRGIVGASPAMKIRRIEERPRERFLSMQEIRSYWHGLDSDKLDVTPQIRLALKMLLVVGQRRAEVSGIVREEIDDDKAIWNLPGERTKNGYPNVVPLTPFAMVIVEEADKYRVRKPRPHISRAEREAHDWTPSPWLFPARRFGVPLLPVSLTQAMSRNRDILGTGDATPHDLRRTFATAHGSIGTPKEIRSALLNHAPDTITGRVYDQTSRHEPAWMTTAKRNAMDRYCQWLQFVIAGEFDKAKAMEGAEVETLSAVA